MIIPEVVALVQTVVHPVGGNGGSGLPLPSNSIYLLEKIHPHFKGDG